MTSQASLDRPGDARTLLRGMLSPPRGAGEILIRISLLAALYGVSGWAGLQLAQPPGYATPIWPPSGIMLAALLLWGNRTWPGVWLGAFLVNAWAGYTQALAPAVLLTIAAAIAGGSTLQGLVGAALVRRHVAASAVLETGPDVWRFFVLGGALSCVIAASVGTAALYLGGRLSAADLGYNWLTWWVGDSMGVFLVAPLILVGAVEQRAIWRSRLRTVALTVLASLAVGALVVHRKR